MVSSLKTFSLLLFTITACAQTSGRLTAAQAREHIGERATVCGIVVSAKFAERSNKKPTFLNLGKPYPGAIFTAVIFESDRPKFGAPERDLLNKKVCVTGTIKEYRGTPEIILTNPNQLAVE